MIESFETNKFTYIRKLTNKEYLEQYFKNRTIKIDPKFEFIARLDNEISSDFSYLENLLEEKKHFESKGSNLFLIHLSPNKMWEKYIGIKKYNFEVIKKNKESSLYDEHFEFDYYFDTFDLDAYDEETKLALVTPILAYTTAYPGCDLITSSMSFLPTTLPMIIPIFMFSYAGDAYTSTIPWCSNDTEVMDEIYFNLFKYKQQIYKKCYDIGMYIE